jgi:hypothetical protein
MNRGGEWVLNIREHGNGKNDRWRRLPREWVVHRHPCWQRDLHVGWHSKSTVPAL